MMHSKKRIIKRVVIACLILVVSGVWLVGYIDAVSYTHLTLPTKLEV